MEIYRGPTEGPAVIFKECFLYVNQGFPNSLYRYLQYHYLAKRLKCCLVYFTGFFSVKEYRKNTYKDYIDKYSAVLNYFPGDKILIGFSTALSKISVSSCSVTLFGCTTSKTFSSFRLTLNCPSLPYGTCMSIRTSYNSDIYLALQLTLIMTRNFVPSHTGVLSTMYYIDNHAKVNIVNQ